ncbi:MAG: hypothetical protein Q4C12_03380 [Clostridia bacterium]|nr:hypothetical protein [Clostridia bacterium]
MKNSKKHDGAAKLFRAMADREYAEIADVPEERLITDPEYVALEEEIDEAKDVEIKGR